MKLYAVRHGEALASHDDAGRALSEKGQQDISKVAHHMKACTVKPAHIIHSPLLRAVQTAEIFARVLGIEQVTQNESGIDGLDPVQPILDMLHHWQDDTMLVGHLPFMSKLISALIAHDEHHAIIRFYPGSIVCLEPN